MTLGCNCAALQLCIFELRFLVGADLPLPDTIKVNFRQSQETVFIALRTGGNDKEQIKT